MEKKQTEWARKVVDMTDDRGMVKKSVCGECARKTAEGRPRKRWTNDLKVSEIINEPLNVHIIQHDVNQLYHYLFSA